MQDDKKKVIDCIPGKDGDLPVDDTSRPIFESFENSIDSIEGPDKAAVIDQFNKLQQAFVLLRNTVGKILSTEEGREIFEKEMRKRRGNSDV